MPRGGARQGAGRKAGRTAKRDDGSLAVGKSISMPRDKWLIIDKDAEEQGVTRSIIVNEALKEYFASKLGQ